MRYVIVGNTKNKPSIAILCPRIQSQETLKYYYNPYLSQLNQDVLVCDLFIDQTKKKTSNENIKEYLNDLLPNLINHDIKVIIVTHPEYFKVLTKQTKTDSVIGDVFDTFDGSGLKAVYCPHYGRIFYDPIKVQSKIELALQSIIKYITHGTSKVGKDIIKYARYPKTVEEIEKALNVLLKMGCDLTCDTENFSLKHYDSGIGTITFCWTQHEGIAFPVDYETGEDSVKIRKLLKDFFIKFDKKIIYHNICYDVYILIYQLFMKDILDQEGLLYGLKIMLKNWDCTQILTYLATNSCAGNELGLKAQAQEFAGNYAQDDIKDIRKIPLDELLEYNLIDGLSTWYTYNKNNPIVVNDNQIGVYNQIFRPAVIDIIQMQLTGMPLNMKKVKALDKLLHLESKKLEQDINNLPLIKNFIKYLKTEFVRGKNEKWKVKVITVDDPMVDQVVFNPNSPDQLQKLLYSEDFLGLPEIDYTDTKLPATGADTLEKLIHHTQDEEVIQFLSQLIEYKASAIIISTFLPAFLKAVQASDGWHYLFGNFRLGGTKSGRLSSNKPNLTNIPSSGSSKPKQRLAKLIKECFEAPPGWLFCGLDFDSLEDKISAVTTRDPQKIKVYSDGYDGHCLRAYAYYSDHMPDIKPDSVDSINSIKNLYPNFRQDSKIPTFALTYAGTYITLMKNCGFSMELAKYIEESYHRLYVVSDEWVKNKLDQACKDGYVTIAFGLRLRTPLLKQVVLNTSKTPYEAQSESRTAGNALGQSWCMLNTRAVSEFMGKVRESDEALNIKPCAQIHDASYYMIRDNIKTVHYTNTHLVKAVSWQEDPQIQNEHISMSGKLSIFYPHWGVDLTIPNHANENEILELTKQHGKKINV